MINGENQRGREGMMPMAANKSLEARNQAVRPQVAGSVCVAAMLLLLVPLLTLEADARGGGGGFGGRGGGFGGHGGGFGGHVGFAGRGGGIGFAGRGAGFGGARSFGVARFGGASFGNRSFGVARIGGTHLVGRPFAGRSLAGRSLSGPRVGMAPARFAGSGTRLATASVRALAGPGLRGAHRGRRVCGTRARGGAAWRRPVRPPPRSVSLPAPPTRTLLAVLPLASRVSLPSPPKSNAGTARLPASRMVSAPPLPYTKRWANAAPPGAEKLPTE